MLSNEVDGFEIAIFAMPSIKEAFFFTAIYPKHAISRLAPALPGSASIF